MIHRQLLPPQLFHINKNLLEMMETGWRSQSILCSRFLDVRSSGFISPDGQGGLAAQVLDIRNGGGGNAQGSLAPAAEELHGAVIDLDLPVPAAAGAGDAVPLADVPNLPQDLLHDQVVEEGPLGGSVLLHPVHGLLQAAHGGKDPLFLAHVAAVQAGIGAGEGQGLLLQEGPGGAGNRVGFLAEEAGDGDPHLIPHEGHVNGGFPARAGQTAARGGQLEHRALQNHRLPALRTNERDKPFCILDHKFFLHGF